ncbi:DUF1292 domain-containing protein [Bacillus sp. Marseille-P3661]|uniref:DUF1292 domain-containing protein n=1 Tax=Bacillus sp. Marseille-P3661 TaxID=1936234 RepID=UPI000C831C53|nr:DUF1292 domain-containing protein [Bacillus sp. Marseille-P3661]
MKNEERDIITIEDEQGNEQHFALEALFDMNEQSYALLTSQENFDETILMRVEVEGENQFLVGIMDPSESEALLNAYQIAVDAAPAE